MRTLDWKGYKWYMHYHCKNDSEHYIDAHFGENAYVNAEYDTLVLPIDINPKNFENDILNDSRKYECACVVSRYSFSYGTFTFKIRLGQTPNTWPAIWLYGSSEWPPEIDVFEAYPDTNGVNYETNIHYKIGSKVKQYGAKRLCNLLYKIMHKKDGQPDTWKLEWTPKAIKIYFNGLCVRRVKDEKVISFFNKQPKMKIVMNNMIRKGFDDNIYKYQQLFEVVDFRFDEYDGAY